MEATFNMNMVILLGICIVMAIMQKKGMMTTNRFGLICVAYFSFFALSAMNADRSSLSRGDAEFEALMLLGIWVFVYPMARWLYGKWHSRNS
ncbi:MAG: hypothetical protein HFACDABA_03240 [Anaerolineales bacterium]|nr:hypothetical protein [Anaerolineales bacterium]